MVRYRHRQVSRVVIGSMIVLTLFFAAIALTLPRLTDLGFDVVFGGAFALAAIAHLLISTLTVEVSERELSWFFMLGFWRNRIALADIVRVSEVRIPWWYGIGIKYTPRAWVYVIAPGAGIEIVARHGDAVWIGTDDPQGLAAALARPN